MNVDDFRFVQLTVEQGGKLISTGKLIPTTSLKIYDVTALDGKEDILNSQEAACHLMVTAPTEAMVVVPSDLTYTGQEFTTNTSLDITKANAEVCGVTFTATAEGWNADGYTAKITYGSGTDAVTVKDAGTYTITYSHEDDSISKTFTVAPATITDTTTATTQTVVLKDGTATLPTAPTGTTVDSSAVTVKYSNDNGTTYTDSSVNYTTAGTYTVYYELSAANHESTKGTITLTVQDIVFTDGFAATISETYGKTWAEILAFDQDTYTATVGGKKEAGTYTLTINGASYSTTDVPAVGTYSWAVTFTSTDKTTFVNIPVDFGTVTITNATITDNTNKTQTVTYTGDAISITAPTGTVVNNQTLSVTYDDDTSYTDVGTYTVGYTLSAPNHTDLNGELTFSITPKSLTISSVSVDTKEYDGTTDATNGAIVLSGAVNNEVPVASGTFTWAETAVGTDAVDVKDIALTDADVNKNYTLSTTTLDDKTVTTEITKRAITITANDQTVTYGTAIDTDTGKVTDTNSKLLSGNNIHTVTLTASSDQTTATGKTITPSAVTIKKGNNDVTANYDITYADGNLTITAKDLTITTLAQEVTYGTAIATTVDKVTITGLIDGETLDSIVLTESDTNVATANKTVKAATPVIKNGDTVIANTNYDITFTETGALTINPLEVVLAWTGENDSPSDFSFSYDGADKTVTATVSNAAYEDELSFEYSESAVGSYTATVTNLGNTNYKLPTDSSVSRTWDITKAPVTITVINNTALTGSKDTATVETNPDLTVTIAYYDRTGALVDDITTAPAGTYSMVASMDSGYSDNYYFSGSVGNTIKLGNFVIAATEPTTYTVTFDETVDSALNPAIAGTIHILPTSTDATAHVGDTFIGWSYNNVVYPAGSTFTQPSKNVEMTAVWETPSTISGTVTNSAGAIVPGATVTISQNGANVANTTTDNAGNYTLPATSGTYQVTVQANGITSTSNVTVDGASVTADVIMQTYSVTVTVEAGVPVSAVDTAQVAEALNDKASADSKTLITVSSVVAPDAVALIAKKSDKIGFYVDIAVKQTVDNTVNDVTDTAPDLVKVTLNIPADLQGKSSYKVYRVHNGVVDTITTGANANGEKLVISPDKTTVDLYVCKFSAYALAYIEYSSGGVSSYASNIASTENGDVTISDYRNKMNATVTITATPDEGYKVGDVTVTYASGSEVAVTKNEDGTYSYKQPGAVATVTVTFEKVVEIDFTDVAEGAYYYNAVKWAVANDITNGTTATTFGPDMTCTRAQAVTFLWNAAGKPQVERENPFTDVDENDWYYEAVLWAVENGITNGISDTTFSPNSDCTRSQIVTFLWNAEKKPVVNYLMTFEDVAEDIWYTEAVRWAVSESITEGTSATTFDPTANCTRAQIVTFLYRNMGE